MSDLQVVVFASQKGGSGKTTLAGHVAVQAEATGCGPVAIIDTDPQGSLAKWWNSREAQTPMFVQTRIPDLAHDIERLRRAGARLVVIDTPPAVTSSIVEVVTHADLVVIPTRPSPHDLRAVGATVDIVEHQNKALVFVVNSATMRARITTETAVALSQHGTVAPSVLHHRVDFAASMTDGRTVMEIDPACRSAKEVGNLWTYLNERLKRLREGPISPYRGAEALFEPEEHKPAPYAIEDISDWDEDDTAEKIAPMPATIASPLSPAPAPAAAPVQAAAPQATSTWDGVDRRKRDAGPPAGVPDRRKAHAFGRRGADNAARAPHWMGDR